MINLRRERIGRWSRARGSLRYYLRRLRCVVFGHAPSSAPAVGELVGAFGFANPRRNGIYRLTEIVPASAVRRDDAEELTIARMCKRCWRKVGETRVEAEKLSEIEDVRIGWGKGA